ncbi:cbb3-type cytochrome c oxidase subunit 3 [Hansschlegelia zhihuaiae]|uniref:Cbb3-type cytochrome c oxidase subunit 3 n=1 Tax=Hansschlegelia zhihuaiae TaxID=405005 RepID=A0A4Q0MIK4_9HYPH|nr:cbb3-type cytochrome c oxidase subunit 3 [Hansschlegelia zhihuaiae]RXF73183.1 cbb3-type cytochrome c oxidase subunit 3 [Hansschlegelia zhihuaiae]
MTYETLAHLAQTAGLLFFFSLFAAVLGYALRPRNRARFDAAARTPLRED